LPDWGKWLFLRRAANAAFWVEAQSNVTDKVDFKKMAKIGHFRCLRDFVACSPRSDRLYY